MISHSNKQNRRERERRQDKEGLWGGGQATKNKQKNRKYHCQLDVHYQTATWIILVNAGSPSLPACPQSMPCDPPPPPPPQLCPFQSTSMTNVGYSPRLPQTINAKPVSTAALTSFCLEGCLLKCHYLNTSYNYRNPIHILVSGSNIYGSNFISH